MHRLLPALLGIVLASAACAAQPVSLNVVPVAPPPANAEGPPYSGPSPEAARLPPELLEQAAAALRDALRREVPRLLPRTPVGDEAWIGRAKDVIAASSETIDHPQLIVVVDRNPRVQEMRIVLALPDAPWEVIGGTKVSTGEPGRFDYYVTPVGVFPHTDAILDYRAEGTFNENHVRGLGLKGMRVWDFGWQQAKKGWLAAGAEGSIRLLMHATDPANLEHRIGRRASKGCIRIPATMNRFLDRHGVLDADYERAAKDDMQYRAVLPPDRIPTPLAGDLLVVFDSATDGAGRPTQQARGPRPVIPASSDER